MKNEENYGTSKDQVPIKIYIKIDIECSPEEIESLKGLWLHMSDQRRLKRRTIYTILVV